MDVIDVHRKKVFFVKIVYTEWSMSKEKHFMHA